MENQHKLHFKIKRNIMNKFLSEPVDALDLRLTKAEALMDGNLVDDPWKVKSERDEESGSVTTVSEEPLDYSDTQDSHDDRVTSSRDDLEAHSDSDDHPDKDVQFIRASSLKSFRNQLKSHHHPQVKSRSSPEPVSSSPRILPTLSTSRPASCLSPHSTYQEYHHHKDQATPSILHFDPSSRVCWPQNDRQDSFGIKKERTFAEETEYIDNKIHMAERFSHNDNDVNPLLSSYEDDRPCIMDHRCGSPTHPNPHPRHPPTRHQDFPLGPPPSCQYLARTYQLLSMGRGRETVLPEHRKDLSRNLRTDSVIVRNTSADVRRLPGVQMSAHYHPYRRLQSSLTLASDHQDWLDNLARLRERIASQIEEQKLASEHGQSIGEYQPRHPPYVSYSSPLIPSHHLSAIKAEPEEPEEVKMPSSKSSIILEDHDRVSSMFLHPTTKASWFGFRPPSPSADRKPLVLNSHVSSHVYPPAPTRDYLDTCFYSAGESFFSDQASRAKRGRPRKHAPKVPLPPLYVFIRNLLHNVTYNPSVISWVDECAGCFKINNTVEFAATWGRMKSNRSEEMNYEKMSRAMRYHYGSVRQGRKGHLAMVKEKRLFYRFGELAINWRTKEMQGKVVPCPAHSLCRSSLCLWTKE